MLFADKSSSPLQILSPGRNAPSIMEAASLHGMPWDKPIGHTVHSNPLSTCHFGYGSSILCNITRQFSPDKLRK